LPPNFFPFTGLAVSNRCNTLIGALHA